jgi:hypothetical protein
MYRGPEDLLQKDPAREAFVLEPYISICVDYCKGTYLQT